MRVKDAVRATTFVRRLRFGDMFEEDDQIWEVVDDHPTIDNGDTVTLRVKHPGGVRARAYTWPIDARVNMIHDR